MPRKIFPLIVLFLATPQIARAQDDPRKAQAEAVFSAGLTEHDAQHEDAALAKFQEAYRIYPSPNVLFNIAREEQLLGKSLEAIRHYRECSSNKLLNPQSATLAQNYIRELQTKLGRIEIVAPAESLVMIDGASQSGASPYDVPPGDHAVLITAPNGKKAEKHCHLDTGDAIGIDVTSDLAGPTLHDDIPHSAGGNVSRSTVFPPPTGAAIVAGVGLVGLGVGVAFAIDSSSKRSNATNAEASHPCANETSPACQQLQDTNSSVGTSKTISEISYVAGGLLIATGIVWWIAAPRQRTEYVAKTHVSPWVGPRGGGVGLTGSF